MIDIAVEGLPCVHDPGRALRVNTALENLRGVGRQQPVGIVEAGSILKGDERCVGSGELLAGSESALEGHEVSVVHDADAHMVRIVEALNLSALHVAGHLT